MSGVAHTPAAETVVRPAEPVGDKLVWYRGWEAGWDGERDKWTREGWVAYRGGCDLDAPTVTGKTWADLLDEIDAEEHDQ